MPIIVAFDLGTRAAGCVVLRSGYPETIFRFRARSCGWSARKQFWAWADNLVDLYCQNVDGRDPGGVVAAESVFYSKFASAVISISRLLGMVEGMAYEHGAKFVEVRASEAKLALAGAGNADKYTMQAFAESQFPDHIWNQHTADALGVALAAQAKLKASAYGGWTSGDAEPVSAAPVRM
jgi:Holliday junction resolvasome RuvABC endonuclease subunit